MVESSLSLYDGGVEDLEREKKIVIFKKNSG